MRITEFAAAMNSRVENLAEDFEIRSITTLSHAQPGDVSFVGKEKYASDARDSRASAIIVPQGTVLEGHATIPLKEPWAGVLHLLEHFFPHGRERYFAGVHRSAVIDPAAIVSPDAHVGPNAVVGPRATVGARTVIGPGCVIGRDCRIGEDCLFHPGAIIAHEVVIGDRVIVHSGSVIGADGFKFEVFGGRWQKIPQVGTVVLEDDVEIGANTCVDRASFTETRIGKGSKIDNLVQIAHNVKIGQGCVIVSQTGIAGSTSVGEGSILAASVGVADNLKIGSRTVLLARAGVKDDIPDGQTYLGEPARPFRKAAKILALQGRLPELADTLAKLEARVKELEGKMASQKD